MDVETPEARPRGTLVAVVRNAVRTHSGGGTQAAGAKRQRKTSNLPPNMWVAQKATKSLPAAAIAIGMFSSMWRNSEVPQPSPRSSSSDSRRS